MTPNDVVKVEGFGPDVSMPADAIGISVWAKVNSADSAGITIDNVKKCDIIRIDYIGGSCAFSDRSGWDNVRSIVGIVGGILTGGEVLGGVGSRVGRALKEAADNANLKSYSGEGKVRNGYGRVKGSKKFARREGGIIVCMPSSRRSIHARDGFHLHKDAEEHGRLHEHVPKELQEQCFFPCRTGRREMEASQNGVICILAFDEDFSDNEGAYELKFTITRSRERDAVEEELVSLFADAGL